jgi:protein SCO1/2
MAAEQPQESPSKSADTSKEKPDNTKKILLYGIGAIVVLALIGLAIWWVRPPEMHGVVLQSPQRLTDFTLDGSTGEPVSLSDFRGKPVLIYFGYTFCPDVCPTTLNDLTDTMAALGKKADDVQVIMVSVDPERDTPEQLATYLKYFDPRFIGMTGAKDDIDAAATQFGVFYEAHEGTAATGYLVDHTSTVALVDEDGYLREIFSFDTPGEDVAADVAYWLR